MVTNDGHGVYISGTTGRPLPLHDPTTRPTPKPATPRKPTGLDWDAHTPICKVCAQRSGQIDGTGLCPACRGVVLLQPKGTTKATYAVLDDDQLAEKFTAPTTVIPTDPSPAADTAATPSVPPVQRPLEQAPPLEAAAEAHRGEPSSSAGEAPPYDCGHTHRTPGCGGCDPSAIDYVIPDGGTPRPFNPATDMKPTPVRAKVRQTSTDDICITLRAPHLAHRQVEISALLHDLLTALNQGTQTPVAAAPPLEQVDRQPAATGTHATTGPEADGDDRPPAETRKGKPEPAGGRPPRQRGPIAGRRGTSGKLAGHDQDIITRYTAGESCDQIARDYQCTAAAIRYLLRRNNVPRRTSGETQRGKPRPTERALTPTEDQDIATQYATGHYSMAHLGAIFGCSEQTIRASLRRTGTPSRPTGTRSTPITSTGA